MNDPVLERHTTILARRIIRLALEDWVAEGWENMPDIGEHDYENISAVAQLLIPPDVPQSALESAHRYFESRTDE